MANAKRFLKVDVVWKDGKNTSFEIDTANYGYDVGNDLMITYIKNEDNTRGPIVGVVNVSEVRTIRTRMVER